MEKKNIFAKFSLKWALAAMLVVGGLATGCKDYDDDIDNIKGRLDIVEELMQDIAGGKLVKDVAQSATGIRVTFTDNTFKDVNVAGASITADPAGNFWMLNVPGGGSVYLPKKYSPLVGLTLIPESIDAGTNGPTMIFGELVLATGTYQVGGDGGADGTYAQKVDTIAGLSTISYLVNPLNVVKSSINPVDFYSVKADVARAGDEEGIKLDIVEWDLAEGVLSVKVRYLSNGEAPTAGYGGGAQDQVSLLVENLLVPTEGTDYSQIHSDFVYARVNETLIVDSVDVFDAPAVTQNVLQFAWAAGTSFDGAAYDETAMSDYTTMARPGQAGSGDAEDFTLNLRQQNSAAKRYITQYDFAKQTGAYVGDDWANGLSASNTDYAIELKSMGFTPVYFFDTLTTDNAADNKVINVSDAGMITFQEPLTASNVPTLVKAGGAQDIFPALYVKTTVSDEEDAQVIAWGAVDLKFEDTPKTMEYTIPTEVYKLKTYLQDTIWIGTVAAMLEASNGVTAAEFEENYKVASPSVYAEGAGAGAGTLAPVGDTGEDKGDAAFDMIIKNGKFGVVIDSMATMSTDASKGASATDFYSFEITFEDKTTASATYSQFGPIKVKGKVVIAGPDMDMYAWAPNLPLWDQTNNRVIVDGMAVNGKWAMTDDLADKFKAPEGITYPKNFVVCVDSLYAWAIKPLGAGANGGVEYNDSIVFGSGGNAGLGDTIILSATPGEYGPFINFGRTLKVTNQALLYNHGGITRVNDADGKLIGWGLDIDGTDKATVLPADAVTAGAVVSLVKEFDLVFNLPVAPIEGGAALELTAANLATDSVFVLNGVKVTNYLKGADGKQPIIQPAANAETTQPVIDTAQAVLFGLMVDDTGTWETGAKSFELKENLFPSSLSLNATTGQLIWTGGSDLRSDTEVIVIVKVLNAWNNGAVGTTATKNAVKFEVPVTLKSVY